MNLDDNVKAKIEDYLNSDKVVLFMKGNPQQPMCGFSAKTVAALDSVVPKYTAVNVLDDPEIREGIKVYGDWPTIPQLYIDGELVGGCDIVLNMLNSGELLFVIRGDDKRRLFESAAKGANDLPVARLLAACDTPVTCFT